MLAAIKPPECAKVGLRRGIELFLLLQHVPDIGVDSAAELRVIRWCSRGRDLERGQRIGQAAQRVKSPAPNPVQLGALVGGGRKAEALVDQVERAFRLLCFDRQLGALAQIGQLVRRLITREMTQWETEALGHHSELGQGGTAAVALDLAYEAFGCEAFRQLFLGQPAGQPGLPKTVSDSVHPTLMSIASLNLLWKVY